MQFESLQAKRPLRNVLFFILLIWAEIIHANPVDMRTAQEVGLKFLNTKTNTVLRGIDDLQWVATYNISRGDAAFYVFNTTDRFVIVAADDCAIPILGYSDESLFDTEDIPIQLQEYLQNFVEQIEYGIVHHLPATETIASQWEMVRTFGHLTEHRSNRMVERLVPTRWNQNCYYNAKCPVDTQGPCNHVYSGCTVTAFAQIMRYWNYPTRGIGSHSYTPPGYQQQTADFGATTYDWANMPKRIRQNSTPAEKDAVATLIWHCGIAIDMNYGPEVSWAYPNAVIPALVNYFGYSDELSMVYKNDYDNDTVWLDMMKSCLDLGRPIHYSGYNQDGEGGHSFICDGYNDEDQLHFNWGWSGEFDGYYSLNALTPTPGDFSYENYAIINIHPVYESDSTFQVTISASPEEGGTVEGGGTYHYNDTVTLTAVPNEGYVFDSWTVGDTAVSYLSTYVFSATDSVACVAVFQPMEGIAIGEAASASPCLPTCPPRSLTQQIYTADEIGGESCDITAVSFFNTDSCQVRNMAVYMVGTDMSAFDSDTGWIAVTEADLLFADSVAFEGHGWTTIHFASPFPYDGSSNVALVVSDSTGDGLPGTGCRTFGTEASQAICAHGADTVYDPCSPYGYQGELLSEKNQVVFGVVRREYTVAVTASPEEGGTVDGGGIYHYNDTVTLTAIPNDGYTFMYWTENEAMVSSDANYSFIVSSDRILVAHFALLFTITTTIEPDEGGIVTGAGVFNSGTTCTITAIPSEGYLFLNWSKDEEVVSCNTSYSFTVTEDAEIKAIFMLLEDTLIGEGEVANMYLPSCSSNSYSLSQQIYTPDEIGASGSITSVSYFNAGETTIRNYDIYMVHTDKSTFDSITDWITVTEANHVFSGSVTLSKGYWSSIVLDIPFEYDGTSNLALIVDDNTGSWANGMDCRVYNTEVNQAIHICSDSTNYSPMEPPTTFGSSEYPIMESVKSQIMLNIEPLKTAQTYALTTGWNWWSTNLDITLEDLQGALMEALPDTSIIIKGKNNTTTYNPNTRRWSGTLLWDVTQMYRILVNNACEITLRGTPVNPDEHPITIVNGANWIAFTLGESMTLTDAFAGFGVDGDIIKSQSHTTQYKSGRWMGKQLTRFEPGKGYLYKSNASESRTFTFPISTK